MATIFSRLMAGFQGFMSNFSGDQSSVQSPGEPLKASEPPGTPPSQFQYPYGYNLNTTPRNEEPVDFKQLRALADNYDLLRLRD